MTTGDRHPPSGARFFKCALQVNPPHYAETFRGQDGESDPRAYAEAIVEKAAEIGVEALAITDHNDVSGVSAFRDAASDYNITVLPGFELTSSEGIHVLCLYNPDTDTEQLDRFLGEFGIRTTGSSSELSDESFEDILLKVREQGGIAIAAHVTNDKGLLKTLTGQARINAWRSEGLLAIQIPGPIGDLPFDQRQIVENKDSNYRRAHAAAAINAKDVAKPEDLSDPSATCWIKMSEISVEGLRQAFLDPVSRIRLNSDPVPEDHAELIALTWEGGFLDGAAIRFNPNLNVLVGGRGTGKSTVVESLRYVLGLDPVGEDARKSHEGIVSNVLRSGTKITLVARSHHPAEREYRIERTVPNPSLVRDENGQLSNLLPKDVLPRVEIYGQHEVSEITRSPQKLTSLLDRFVQRDPSLDKRKASVRRGLQQTRESIIGVQSELQQIDERLAALPGLEETLRRFKEAGLEDRLREQSLLVREEQALDSIPGRVRTFRECLETLRQELPIDLTFLSPKALEGLPGREILAQANGALGQLSQDLGQIAQRLAEALARADEGIEDVRSRWAERKAEVEAEYQKILRELQKSAVDGEEFIRLRREIENLRPLRERRSALERLEKEHTGRRRALLGEWEDIKASEFRLLDHAAQTVSFRLRDRGKVEVAAAGNREPLFKTIREEIVGRLYEAINALRQAPDLSLPEFVERCRAGADEIQKAYDAVPPAQAERLSKASDDTLMKIEELELPATITLHLNTAPAGAQHSWQALDDLSTGQKATAVLLLLLLESDAPLIVDQPEDDLDNRFITEGVVPKMREEKRRRQFLFSTHNANIPVLGDAELIIGLDASGAAGDMKAVIQPERMGSIDTLPVRELVEEILEGGKNAFETRRLKYGF